MFFLATADAEGRPQCSYKGGEPGFVRVLDERTVAFPNYDGNGMYLSMGNALENPHVGMLFIDFTAERPVPAAAERDRQHRRVRRADRRPTRRRSSSSGSAPPRCSPTARATSTGWRSSSAPASFRTGGPRRRPSRPGSGRRGRATCCQPATRPGRGRKTAAGIETIPPSLGRGGGVRRRWVPVAGGGRGGAGGSDRRSPRPPPNAPESAVQRVTNRRSPLGFGANGEWSVRSVPDLPGACGFVTVCMVARGSPSARAPGRPRPRSAASRAHLAFIARRPAIGDVADDLAAPDRAV